VINIERPAGATAPIGGVPYSPGGIVVITLTTYAEAKEALRHRDLRQALYDEGERLMGDVIVNLHGDAHVARRRLENRLFRRDTFAWYERDRIPAIIAEELAGPVVLGRGDLLPLARHTMMRLSVDVAGVEVTAAESSRFFGLMERLARASTVAHATGDKAVLIADGDDALAEFERLFYRRARERRAALVTAAERGELDDDDLPRDVLTTLLRNHDRLDLPAATVLREVAYFPWVGSHSTSGQFVHAMHHVFEWLDDHPDERPRLRDDDALLQRFVHESMRLHPASPIAKRIATTDVQLRTGRLLPEGATVVIDLVRANRDEAVFGPDAGQFSPLRPPPPGIAPWGLSFGHGTHACLGQELAGGLDPGAAATEHADHHLLGAVAVMAGALLAAGARPDPDDPPSLDQSTTRDVWGRYPVRFDPTSKCV
jgi:cytochrome P450